MKKIWSCLASAAMLFSSAELLPAAAQQKFEAKDEECAVFDQETGVLTLHGNVTTEGVQKYNMKPKVKKVIAEEGTVLPADSSLLFYGMGSVSIDLSKADTSNVTEMDSMFYGCLNLKELDLSGFDTSAVTRMDYMFNHCEQLEQVDLSGFDTANVTTMEGMFYRCLKLKELDCSEWDTSNVTTMLSMFVSCNSLEKLDLSGFDTSKVTNMSGMFSECFQLSELNLSGFDTSNVELMSVMFASCLSLRELDLSGFDTSSVKAANNIFFNCTNLETIYASDKWNNSSLENGSKLFGACPALRGGNGTTYSDDHVSAEYARIDTAAAPGYFTGKGVSAKPEYLPGDLNGDNEISVEDAQLALADYVNTMSGMETALTARQLLAGDINGDQRVTVEDAQVILRYYVSNTLSGESVTWEDLLK